MCRRQVNIWASVSLTRTDGAVETIALQHCALLSNGTRNSHVRSKDIVDHLLACGGIEPLEQSWLSGPDARGAS